MADRIFQTQEIGSLSPRGFLVYREPRSPDQVEANLRSFTTWADRLSLEPRWRTEGTALVADAEAYSSEAFGQMASVLGLRFFEGAGLDVVYDGEQRRPEMYEYFVKHIGGLELSGEPVIVWRKPNAMGQFYSAVCKDRPELKYHYHRAEAASNLQHARRPENLKVPITGPYTLTKWTVDEYFGKAHSDLSGPERRARSFSDLLAAFTGIVKEEVRTLREAGFRRIQVDEPQIGAVLEEVPAALGADDEIFSSVPDAVTALHICYADWGTLIPHLSTTKARQITISCADVDTQQLGTTPEARRGYQSLGLFKEYGFKGDLMPGVVEVHVDKVEPWELIRDRLLFSQNAVGDGIQIVAAPDCGLRTRKWEVAYEKSLAMVKGAEAAREALA